MDLDNEISVVLTCDDRYVRHTAAAICSIVKNSKRKFKFYVFDCGIKEENLQKLKTWDLETNEICIVPVKKIDVFEKCPLPSHFSPAIFYRIFIPEILSHLDKAIYLDSDIIALGDLGELWDIDLNERLLGVVFETGTFFAKHKKEIGLPCNKKYFNSGVLLMHLKQLRAWGICEKIINLFKHAQTVLSFPDQDALNIIMEESQLLELDSKYNFMPFSCYSKSSSMINFCPVCAHYTLYKPWTIYDAFVKYLPFYTCRWLRLYYKYARETPWVNVLHKDASFKSFFKMMWKNTFQPLEHFVRKNIRNQFLKR